MDNTGRRTSRAYWASAYTDFRRRLITARETAGMSQREAAVRLGRSQSFVAKSENGERRVDVVELSQFAALYNRALAYFFPGRRTGVNPKR
jgi:transcriptional regulator with XRE-family HTH domain